MRSSLYSHDKCHEAGGQGRVSSLCWLGARVQPDDLTIQRDTWLAYACNSGLLSIEYTQ
jgi:hypothetical protein